MYRLPENNGTACILSRDKLPSIDTGYKWVEDFVKNEKLQVEIEFLQSKRAEVEVIPISKSEKIARLRIGYADYQKKIYDRVEQYLNDQTLWHYSVKNPLLNFENRFYKRDDYIFIPPLSVFEEAINQQRDDGISDHDREKQLRAIDAKIDDLKNKIPNAITKEHLAFVSLWRDVQSQLSEPTGPRALSIDASSDDEKRAWKLLGLKEYINPRGIKPNPAE